MNARIWINARHCTYVTFIKNPALAEFTAQPLVFYLALKRADLGFGSHDLTKFYYYFRI